MKYLLFTLSFCISCIFSQSTFAQLPVVTEKDAEKIVASAKLTLANYINVLDNLGDENNDADAKQYVINNAINGQENAVAKFNAKIETDIDGSHEPNGAVPDEVKAYLESVAAEFHKTGESSTYKIFDISCIKYTKESNIYIIIPFSHTFNGTNKNKVKYTENKRYALMSAFPSGKGEWRTLITTIGFYDPKNNNSNNCLEIAKAQNGQENQIALQERSDEYCAYMLQKGDKLSAQSNFEGAYFSYKEAQKRATYKKEAAKRIDILFDKMKRAGIEGVNDRILKNFTIKGNELEISYRFEDALSYYTYARDLDPANANVTNRLRNTTSNVIQRRTLADYFEQKSYEQGVAEYTKAIENTPDDPNYYIGRAKCNYKLRKDYEAQSDFRKASNLDASNPELYLWLGQYFEQKNRPNYFDSAYSSYVTYTAKSEDAMRPDVRQIYARAVFCKGMKLYKQTKYLEAIDSFKQAVMIVPQFAEAYCYAGASLLNLGKIKEAQKTLKKSIEINEKYADAHYWYAKSLAQTTDDFNANTKEIFEEWKTAILLENNGDWCIELGNLLIAKGEMLSAIDCFNRAIKANPNRFYMAYLYKARCHKAVNSIGEARDDYNKYIEYLKKMNKPLEMSVQKEIDELGK